MSGKAVLELVAEPPRRQRASFPEALRTSLGALVTACLAASVGCSAPPPPLPHHAYVWQNRWTPAVAAAVAGATTFRSLVVLAAEVDASGSPIRVARAGIDWAVLGAHAGRVGLALRINRGPSSFALTGRVVAELGALAAGLVETARAAEIDPVELQVDFDCPESRLGDYRHLLRALAGAVRPVPLVVLALPAWLRHERQFGSLLGDVGGFVLQVHSLTLPGRTGPASLCDAAEAREAVARAAHFGRPFRVALPTHGYDVALDAGGALLGVWAERGRPPRLEAATLRRVASDPAAMAELVRHWSLARPRELTGIVWFRLPVRGDRLSWSPEALAAVMTGRSPRRHLAIETRHREPELIDLEVVNSGEIEVELPRRVTTRWRGAEVLAADALGDYHLEPREAGSLVVVRPPGDHGATLAPGACRMIGWLRFDRPTEVSVEVEPSR